MSEGNAVTSSPNLDLVRSIVSDWERGDFGLVGWADAEIEFVIADGPEPVSLRGLRATLEYWRGLLGSWAGYRIVGDGYRELSHERVLVLAHARGARGQTSGSEVERDARGGALVFTVSAGDVTRLVAYLDRDRAPAELGLGQ